ncbi:MAG: histidine kinase [Rikenellaceae bacterium]
MSTTKTERRISLLKLIGWCVIIAVSLFWSAHTSDEGLNLFGLLVLIMNFIPLILIYAINSLLLIPRYLFRDQKGWFLVTNFLVLVALLFLSYHIDDREIIASLNIVKAPPFRARTDMMFLARELINYVLMIGFVTSLNLMGRLQKSEEALREAENARIKAELTNLRSQLNPHFLLNTLNNIYALTVIDSEKAQKAIKELSHLLRYVLYDNLSEKVLLIKEVEFLHNYIELMRIRLTKQVQLVVESNVTAECSAQIAPLIFISLIENAFKHGVSADEHSFINIKIDNNCESREVTLSIRNSNHAKSSNDKSGCGIGLDQVRRRLELQYPGLYRWDINESSTTYESILTLKGC